MRPDFLGPSGTNRGANEGEIGAEQMDIGTKAGHFSSLPVYIREEVRDWESRSCQPGKHLLHEQHRAGAVHVRQVDLRQHQTHQLENLEMYSAS